MRQAAGWSAAEQPGDLIFAQSVCVEGIRSLDGFGGAPLLPAYEAQAVKLRRELERAAGGRRLGDAGLQSFADALRGGHLGMVERLLTPPRLANSDGGLFRPRMLRYRVALPPAATFAALASLAPGQVPVRAVAAVTRGRRAGLVSRAAERAKQYEMMRYCTILVC